LCDFGGSVVRKFLSTSLLPTQHTCLAQKESSYFWTAWVCRVRRTCREAMLRPLLNRIHVQRFLTFVPLERCVAMSGISSNRCCLFEHSFATHVAHCSAHGNILSTVRRSRTFLQRKGVAAGGVSPSRSYPFYVHWSTATQCKIHLTLLPSLVLRRSLQEWKQGEGVQLCCFPANYSGTTAVAVLLRLCRATRATFNQAKMHGRDEGTLIKDRGSHVNNRYCGAPEKLLLHHSYGLHVREARRKTKRQICLNSLHKEHFD